MTRPGKTSRFRIPSPFEGRWVRLRLTLLFLGVVGPLVGSWYVFYVPANEIAWAEDYADAQRRASESGRPMILYLSAEWCSPCRIMRRQVWADDEVESIVRAGYVALAVDVQDPEANAALLERYPVQAWPTTYVANAQGEVLAQAAGGLSKSEFLQLLESAEDAR